MAGLQKIQKPTRARALDTSGNNNHGQIYSGRGLEFDGVSDYFLHNGGTILTGINKFNDGVAWTFASWIYVSGAGDMWIVGGTGTQPHFKKDEVERLIFRSDDSAKYYIFLDSDDADVNNRIQLSTWYRLVMVCDGSNITAYLNGQFFGKITAGQNSRHIHYENTIINNYMRKLDLKTFEKKILNNEKLSNSETVAFNDLFKSLVFLKPFVVIGVTTLTLILIY